MKLDIWDSFIIIFSKYHNIFDARHLIDRNFLHDFCVFFLQEMAINSYDIVSTLQALGMMKYWKGKHIILKKQVSALIALH
jgi:hypothetical protein